MHTNTQKQPSSGVLRKRCSENMQQIYRRKPMPKCDFNRVAKQLYWNRTSAWVFSCKFAAYFQNNFSSEQLWKTTPLHSTFTVVFFIGSLKDVYIRCLTLFQVSLIHRRWPLSLIFGVFSLVHCCGPLSLIFGESSALDERYKIYSAVAI